MCTLGDPPPGSSWIIRNLARFGRKILRIAFLRNYRRHLMPDLETVEAWKLPVVTARIAEGIEAELPALEKLARQLINDKQETTP
jgi:hypothetical protein